MLNFYRIANYLNKKLNFLRIAFFNSSPNICIGRGTYLESGVTISVKGGGKIIIGNNCYVSKGAQLLTHGGNIEIGDSSTVNPNVVVYGQGGTRIGKGVRIANNCTIVSANHLYEDANIPIYKQGFSMKGIVIEDDVWLGSGVRVLDGVIIRKGCVIGANAVVTHSTEENGVYIGVPARKVKSRT